jgi:hypothetical protein
MCNGGGGGGGGPFGWGMKPNYAYKDGIKECDIKTEGTKSKIIIEANIWN